MTAIERAAKAAYEAMVARTTLRWDDMSKIDWAWEKQSPAVRADWMDAIAAAVTEERKRCADLVHNWHDHEDPNVQRACLHMYHAIQADPEECRRTSCYPYIHTSAATFAKALEEAEEMLRPEPDVMIGGEG